MWFVGIFAVGERRFMTRATDAGKAVLLARTGRKKVT